MRSRSVTILTVVFAGVVILGLCGVITYLVAGDRIADMLGRLTLSLREDEINAPFGADNTPRELVVNPGDAPALIARELNNLGVIGDPELFFDYVRYNGIDVQIEAGTYFFNQTQSIAEIAQSLTDSSSASVALTIFAGWRIEQIAEAIDANPKFIFSGAEFLDTVQSGFDLNTNFREVVGLPDGASLEGFMYPDYYVLPPQISAVELRDEILERFIANVNAQLFADAQTQEFTMYELITLASIVQREAIHLDEQPLIAGVYRNRLDIGMRMDADPTVQYPLGNSRGSWWPRITQNDYTSVVSPYNTYLNLGLPPGPIASPGISAIRAAIYPEASEFLFFRADCRTDGYHEFARTYAEHLENGC